MEAGITGIPVLQSAQAGKTGLLRLGAAFCGTRPACVAVGAMHHALHAVLAGLWVGASHRHAHRAPLHMCGGGAPGVRCEVSVESQPQAVAGHASRSQRGCARKPYTGVWQNNGSTARALLFDSVCEPLVNMLD